jgi:type IV pilus assembly protein PilQ
VVVGVGQPARRQHTRILSPRGSVIYETRTNQLFVSDIPSKLEEIQSLIAKIDIPVRQVLIEARIVEADDSFGRALGVKLGSTDLRGLRGGIPGYRLGGGNYVTIGGNYSNVGVQTGQTPITATSYLPIRSSSTCRPAPAGWAPTAGHALGCPVQCRGQPLPEPRAVGDGVRRQGQDRVQPARGHGRPAEGQHRAGRGDPVPGGHVQRRDLDPVQEGNLRLEVTPQITPEGNVIMTAGRQQGQPSAEHAECRPGHQHQEGETQVLVENGGTVVIGGIFTQDDRDEINKVPLLGDMPYIGYLFQNKSRISTKTELLVFITPKIVTDRSANGCRQQSPLGEWRDRQGLGEQQRRRHAGVDDDRHQWRRDGDDRHRFRPDQP